MKIRALMAVAIVEASTGKLISIPHGGIAEISDELAESLINDKIAEEYTLLSPTGTVSITKNGTVDVTEYASANVNIPGPSGSISITENGTVDVADYASANVNVTDYTAFKAYASDSLTIILPEMLDGVTELHPQCFRNCTNLTTVNIPSSVTKIGSTSFYGCTSLKNVVVQSLTPPILESSVFSSAHEDLTIYVIGSVVDTYKAAPGWSNFASKIQAMPE